MFTLRFIRHGERGYDNIAAARYSVEKHEDDSRIIVTLPNGTEEEYTVGAQEYYAVCYITNTAGKTIDKVGP
jgi:hypothetical protein